MRMDKTKPVTTMHEMQQMTNGTREKLTIN